MWRLLWEAIWGEWQKCMSIFVTLVSSYSWVAENHYPNSRFSTMKDLLPAWEWWVWVIIALVWLCFSILTLANRQRRQLETHSGFIIAGKAKTGKNPPVPDSLLHFVNNYTRGEPISKKLELRDPSLQEWHGLTENNRDRYLQIKDFLGQDRDDFLQHLKDTAPPRLI